MRSFRNLDLWSSEREKAEVLPCGLKVLKDQTDGPRGTIYGLKIWNPKAVKPYANYGFRTAERRDEYLAEQIKGHESYQAIKAKRKADRKGTPEDLAKVKVGTIFAYSWGYEQTNVDFYEVVELKGSSVLVREIGLKSTGATGSMSDNVVPCKGNFTGPALLKKLSFSNGQPLLSMPHGGCSVWDGRPEYRSWYA